MPGDAARAADPPKNSPEVEAAYQAAPEEMIAEIIDGELSVLPRPAIRHVRASHRLGLGLGPFDLDTGPGGWVILTDPELWLGPRPDRLVPDLAGWRRQRMPDVFGPEDGPAHLDLAPDWACEIVSPASEGRDRGAKMRIYRREGVGHYWVVNPVLRTLEVYRRVDERFLLVDTFEGNVKVRAEPFDAIELDLGLLWAP